MMVVEGFGVVGDLMGSRYLWRLRVSTSLRSADPTSCLADVNGHDQRESTESGERERERARKNNKRHVLINKQPQLQSTFCRNYGPQILRTIQYVLICRLFKVLDFIRN